MKLSEKQGNILHGILLITLFSCAAFYLADTDIARRLSFSPLIIGILLGMLYANSLRNRLPETWVPGILFCSKQILRAGIVLYGFRLTFQSVAAIGTPAIGIDAIVVVGTILLGILLGTLWMLTGLKMPKTIADSVTLISQATTPCALMAVGMGLASHSISAALPKALTVTAVKVTLQPLCVYVLCRAIGLSEIQTQAATLLSSLPVAVNLYIMAAQFESEEDLASSSIFISTFISAFTVPLTMTLLSL